MATKDINVFGGGGFVDALKKLFKGGVTGGGSGGGATRRPVVKPTRHPKQGMTALYGFGCDVLGAAAGHPPATKPRAGFVAKTVQTPRGPAVHTSLVVNTPPTGHDDKSIANARTAGQRAVDQGNKIKDVLKKTKIHGAGSMDHVVKKAMGAAQLKKLADVSIKAGNDALKGADKHQNLVDKNNARIQHGSNAVRGSLTQVHITKGTGVHGDELLGSRDSADWDEKHDLEVLGYKMQKMRSTLEGEGDDLIFGVGTDPRDIQVLGAAMDISDDLLFGDDAAPADDSAAATAPGSEVAALGPAPSKAPPLQPGVDYAPAPGDAVADQTLYGSQSATPLPNGAIVYDGSRGTPRYGFGSTSYWSSGQKKGAIWGWDHQNFPNSGDPMRWISLPGGGNIAGPDWDDIDATAMKNLGMWAMQKGYGPLVGNPNMPDFKNLRYDTDTATWFWYRDQAPGWASAPDDAKRFNQAILDYKAAYAAAAADDAAAAAQAKLDADQAAQLAKTQAAEDAATQRQMDKETAQAQHESELAQYAPQAAPPEAPSEPQSAEQAVAQFRQTGVSPLEDEDQAPSAAEAGPAPEDESAAEETTGPSDEG